MKILLALLIVLLPIHRAYCEDWTVVIDNAYSKTFHGVTVTKVTPAEVSIIYDSGAATLKIGTLPADLQKRFNYDPAKAAAAINQDAIARQNAIAYLQAHSKPAMDAEPIIVSPSAPMASQVDKQAILNQISALQQDISEKTSQMALERAQAHKEGRVIVGNGFNDLIQSEQAQISQLKSQITQN